MKLKYLVLAKEPKVLIKFFFEEEGKHGEFKIELAKEAFDKNRPQDTIGVRGDAEIWNNYPEGTFDVSEAFVKAMGFGKKIDPEVQQKIDDEIPF